MTGAFETGIYRNVFKECGYTEAEIEQRVEDTFRRIFHGTKEECFYHEVGEDMAYVEDTGNHDVRTEGMSYGMMVCVQLDRKEEFDRLWKWARTYMYLEGGSGHNYFAWSCAVDGSKNAEGPAPDGEEFFAMALFFASNRWGDGDGIFAYSKEARAILSECIHKGEEGHPGEPMWNPDLHLDKIYYGEQNDQNPYYLLKPEIILQNVENLSKAADTYGGAGISLRDIGYELSADYNQKQLVTRENMKKEQVALLNGIKASGQKIMTNMGNDYTLGVTDFITNMDLNGSGYTILDAAVPFYQIAIHGYVNYAGEALNLTADCEEELLKSAEYGAGLYFSLMDADATELQNTKYTQYFGANYEASKDELFAIYTRYQKELGSVFHQRIVDHAILDSGITLTVYEDGTKVYVNYNYDNVTMDGIEIPARDYLVMP